jgi:cyclophilin family peptidyl-prolyl cis-trans isomerase
MSRLSELPELVGFFSYSREDDEDSYGALSALRERIQRELRAQLGRSTKTFRLWQDKEAIASGKLWEAEIKIGIWESVFFIPIITPTVVNSPYCKFELDAFLARENELGRDDLVFPILYIKVPELEDSARWKNDPVLSIIAKRQYRDWRAFRHRDVHSTDVKEAVERFCSHICEALQRQWLTPEELKAREEAAALGRAEAERARREAEMRRSEDEAHRKAAEEEARQRAQEERRRREAAAEQERLEAERRRLEAGARQREEEDRRKAEEAQARQRADDERRARKAEAGQKRAEEQRRYRAADRQLLIGFLLIAAPLGAVVLWNVSTPLMPSLKVSAPAPGATNTASIASVSGATNTPIASPSASVAPETNAKLVNPAALNETAPTTYKTRFDTSKGVFVVEVHRDFAPNGADRFYNLVKNGFYDDNRFFRVISGFMVQFGINGNPKISAPWRNAQIKDDLVKQSNKRGFITFATSGPNSRTTQVFINFVDRNSFLDRTGFSPFGQVTSGLDVVDALYSGYGEGAPNGGGPDQGRIQAEGNAYLMKDFPKLDYVRKATIER